MAMRIEPMPSTHCFPGANPIRFILRRLICLWNYLVTTARNHLAIIFISALSGTRIRLRAMCVGKNVVVVDGEV